MIAEHFATRTIAAVSSRIIFQIEGGKGKLSTGSGVPSGYGVSS
jgi:hypothetical protein